MLNLLLFAHHSLNSLSDRIYLGEGVPPFPEKIASKIQKGKFVEMGELLPEFWSPSTDESQENKLRHSQKVTDIITWLQCYTAYVSVRAPPHHISHPQADVIHGYYR